MYEEELGSELGSGSELGNLFAQDGGLTRTCWAIIYIYTSIKARARHGALVFAVF